jgi:ribonuclease HII
MKYLIGIDEVGRGPLAGPVAVGAILCKGKVPKRFSPGKDSKQLSPEARDAWFLKIQKAKKDGELDYAVSFVSAQVIDKKGLSFAIRKALETSLQKVLFNKKISPKDCLVLLDGGLKAPIEFIHQKTIIKGDEKEPIIALASIAAKVLRDRKMCTYSKTFKNHSFAIHKGYGTKTHYAEIMKYSLTQIHRRSFLKRVIHSHV